MSSGFPPFLYSGSAAKPLWVSAKYECSSFDRLLHDLVKWIVFEASIIAYTRWRSSKILLIVGLCYDMGWRTLDTERKLRLSHQSTYICPIVLIKRGGCVGLLFQVLTFLNLNDYINKLFMIKWNNNSMTRSWAEGWIQIYRLYIFFKR